MLLRLLTRYSRPYRGALGVVALLQLASVVATLYLPSVHGDIIDRGVATGDASYVLRHGGLMLGIAALQVAAANSEVMREEEIAKKNAELREASLYQDPLWGRFQARGWLEKDGEKFVIRWARDVPTDKGRTLTFVTDTPVFFVGAGKKDAKPTAGYEVAVLELTLDKTGKGTGRMAAAARVKPGGETGVRIDVYADALVTLTATARAR